MKSAKKIQVSSCDHGTVFIELLDGSGKRFAVAPMDPTVARAVAKNLTEACDDMENGGGSIGECKGHA